MNKIVMWILIVLGSLLFLGFVFGFVRSQFTEIKKPAIYLYPENDMDVNVRLTINGKLTITDPIYVDGWNVYATTDGKILYNAKQYDYLFYEASLKGISIPEEGWVVAYDELDGWFDIYLVKLGLNDKETNQFKEYWMNELPKKEFYEIHLLSDEFLENNMILDVYPAPDSVIRVNLCFKGLNYEKKIVEPNIITPERKGFTVVEWGGALI